MKSPKEGASKAELLELIEQLIAVESELKTSTVSYSKERLRRTIEHLSSLAGESP